MTTHLRHIARYAGWPLLADALNHLHQTGQIHTTHINTLTTDDATAMGEDYIAKTINHLETDIITATPTTTRPLNDDQVRDTITAAALPTVMAEFLTAVHDQGQTNAEDIEYLTHAELHDLYDTHILPTLTNLAQHLRHQAHHPTAA